MIPQATNSTREVGMPLGYGRTAEVSVWSPGWVVKLFYPMHPLAWIEQEATIATLVFDTTKENDEFRTPQVGEIVTVGGRYGLLYQHVEGKPLSRLLSRSSRASIDAVGARLAELHFAIHRIRFKAGAQVSDLPSQRTMFSECIANSSSLPADLHHAAKRSLSLLDFELRDDCLCHCDFHPLNVLVTGHGHFVVIDWWTAERGNPIADFARTLILLEFGRISGEWIIEPAEQAVRRKLRDAYLQRYLELAGWSKTDSRLKQWVLLAIAARLNNGIGNAERSALLAYVQKLLKEELPHGLLRGSPTGEK
ncbi:MAG TPA: aminoglycoside phosphotransferase family protein [Burkholderiaceae bacterium]|jgi:hypothetical protein